MKGGSVISKGYNKSRSCINGKEVPSMHAEILALQNRRLNHIKGSSMFLVRITSTGLALSKPCLACLQALREFGVKKIYYSTRDGIEVERVSDLTGYRRSFGKLPTDAPRKPYVIPLPE
eukprot:TRINITY_DN6239_c0_g1_i1.p1 TRINITY_DN6239_c0_g1~~TRINITY_DN6239_c0_g1_i1.p1  ORF type:complete len:119 (+),score=7.04 TRINITY_DN6239_c0_g1_i1:136-492(+)